MVVVFVDVVPEPAPEIAQAAIDGCNGALGTGSCALASSDPRSVGEFYALVHSASDRPDVFVVELRRRTRSGLLLETRELRFAERDTSRERSTSLGVVIAALVAAQGRRERAAAPKPVPRPPPPRPAPPRAPVKPRAPQRSRVFRIDAGATLTKALEEHPFALGGLGRLSMTLEPSPLFALLSGGYESDLTSEPDLQWLLAGIGLGVRVGAPRSPLGLELYAEALVERVGIEARDPAGTDTATASRWRGGARAGFDGVWSWSEHWGLVGGLQLSLLRPAVLIEVRNRAVERAAVPSGGLFIGLRYSP